MINGSMKCQKSQIKRNETQYLNNMRRNFIQKLVFSMLSQYMETVMKMVVA